MSQHPPTGSAPQFELLGLQHQGCSIEFAWQWPASASQAGFGEILAGLQGVDTTLLHRAQACSLQRVGSPEQPVWLLSNGSQELVCSLNGQALPAGSQMRLDHGDEIELGLSRFLVSLEPSATPLNAPAWEPVAPAEPPPLKEGFELTDLDALADISALTDAEHQGLKRSDFGDLISLQPETVPAAGLGQPPTPSPQDAQASQSDAAAQAPAGGSAEKPSSLLEAFGAGAEQPKATPILPDDPLESLHSLYLAKLRNPNQGDLQDLWQDMVRGDQSRQADPMQQWMQAAGPSQSLDDLLGQAHSIASVMQSLDALGGVDVLAPEPFDSVMHLFAPAHLRVAKQDSLEHMVQTSLPGLTQREHHSLSLDSAMPFTGGQEPPSKPKDL